MVSTGRIRLTFEVLPGTGPSPTETVQAVWTREGADRNVKLLRAAILESVEGIRSRFRANRMTPEDATELGDLLGSTMVPQSLGQAGLNNWIKEAIAGTGHATLEICAASYPTMWEVPWELLHLGDSFIERNFVLNSESVDFVRIMSSSEAGTRPLEAHSPLRILVVSGPADDIDGDDPTYETLTNRLASSARVEVIGVAEQPTLLQLNDRLRSEGPVDVVVFRGHGSPDGLRMSGSGNPLVRTAEIVECLSRNGVRAALLLACNTADGSVDGLAIQLARAGIHTIAFVSKIGAEQAAAFADAFAVRLAALDHEGSEATLPSLFAAGRERLRFKTEISAPFAQITLWQPGPRPLRLLDATAARPVPGVVPGLTPAGIRAQIVYERPSTNPGHAFAAVVWANGLRIDDPDAAQTERVLVSPDGRLVAHRSGSSLDYVWVNRARTEIHSRPDPIDLSDLGEGEVLAVSRSGLTDVLFVWADGVTTALWQATAAGALRRVGAWPFDARLALVSGSRVLFADRHGGQLYCPAFPGLEVETLQAASSGGVTAVLALGHARSGARVACVRTGGDMSVLDSTEVSIVLPLNPRQPPMLRVGEVLHDLTEPDRPARLGFTLWTDDLAAVVARRRA